MATDLRKQATCCGTSNRAAPPDKDILVSDAVFGPETPLHMSEEQMATEFAYIMSCYSTPEADRHE